MSGRADNAVFVQRADGSFGGRVYVTPTDPRTPAQVAVRDRFTRATRAFHSLTGAQYAAWEAYAESLTYHDATTNHEETPSPIGLFVGMATKFLQVNPLSPIPLLPPSADFAGDTISVTFAAGSASGEVTVTASGPNASGVVTELQLQRLTGPGRRPRKNGYRTQAFNEFTAGPGLTVDLADLTPGYYAAAYRFVEKATGRDTLLYRADVFGAVTEEAAMPLRKAA